MAMIRAMSGFRCVQLLVFCFLTFLFVACASSSRGRLIETVDNPKISEREVRAQVNAHLLRYSSMVEYTVHEFNQRETAPHARIAVLYWQMNGITTCRGAAFLDDPLAAALDCWVLGIQELEFYEGEKGKRIFGDAQPLIVERLESVHLPFRNLVKSWTTNNDDLHTEIESFAKKHPMANMSYGRESLAAEVARIVGDSNLGFLASVGTLDERIQDITERLNIYMQQVPNQLRWTTALIQEELNQSEEVNGLIQDLHEMNASLQRLSTLEDRLPKMIDDQVDMGMEDLSTKLEPALETLEIERVKIMASVTREREATLAEVDRQRLDTLAFVTAERKVMEKVLDDKVGILDRMVETELTALSSMIDKQTTQLTEEVNATTTLTLQQADELAETRISQLAWSLLLVGGGLIFLFFLFRFLSMRYLS
jgi:hypothetical protein